VSLTPPEPQVSSPLARSYARWATLFLAITVMVGAWMRAIIAWPAFSGGVDFGNLRHAHSHVAFFGWVTMAIFALMVGRVRPDERVRRRLSAYGTALGVASIAAFLSFLRAGYDAISIGISVVHVVLWFAFSIDAWPLLDQPHRVQRWFWRGALVFLMLAGASTLGPGVVVAGRVSDPWLRELAVKAFLAFFIGGFVLLGTYGALYRFVPRARFAGIALALASIGVPATALLHVGAAPPAWWIVPVGRAGTLLVGVAALLVVTDLRRARRAPALVWVATIALAAKGVLEVLAGLGVGLALIRSQPIVVAYLHLVLLGVVTAGLLGAIAVDLPARRRATALALGVSGMLAPLAAMGWPFAYRLTTRAGGSIQGMLEIAFAGGMIAAVAILAMVAATGQWRRAASAPVRWRARGAPEEIRVSGAGT
jgi:hypothetical protein